MRSYSSRGDRQRRHGGDDWLGCTTKSVLLLGTNLGGFGCGGCERGYGHLRLGPWRPHALILNEEVAGEVVHAFAVSSMRRRKKTRPPPVNRYDGSTFGLRPGPRWAVVPGLIAGLLLGCVSQVSLVSPFLFLFYYFFVISVFNFIFEF